jgi:hypothetical protein
MKKIIRLTESDLHNIIKESVNKALRESEYLDAEPYDIDVFDNTYDDDFDNIMSDYSKMPDGYDDDIDPSHLDSDRIAKLNKNYEAEAFPYLKGVQNNASWQAFDDDVRRNRDMWESIIRNSINKVLKEDGEIGGGGATNCVGINVGGAAGQAKNHIDAAPFSNKPLKQKHNLGNPTTKKANMVDITPALDRTPGFSMGERVGGKKKK